MSFSNLNADQLARVDALCMQFESLLRKDAGIEIEKFLADYDGPEKAAVVEELRQIEEEIGSQSTGAFGTGTFEQENKSGRSAELSPLLAAGTKLGPYTVERLIGSGGMGQVFVGQDERLQRDVAIKVLADDWLEQPDRIDRFNLEARIVAALRHPNIVSIYDVGVHDGRPYAVMEYLEGETVRARMRRGPLTASEVRRIGLQAANALEAAHGKGIIHRDLKPENLFIQPDGELKLLDFGLSRADAVSGSGSRPTATGVILGTLGYLSPEQARGDDVTPQSDLFSLGCVLFEMFYGDLPFAGRTPSESIASILNDTPAIQDPQRDQDDPSLAELIHRCVAKNPAARMPDAGTMKRLIAGESSSHTNVETSGDGLFDRRTLARVLGGIAAGAGGLAVYQSFFAKHMPAVLMPHFDSIAVVQMIIDDQRMLSGPAEMLLKGEELAAVLSNKLGDVTDLEVRPFHAVKRALELGDVHGLAKQLDVDALITGKIVTTEGEQRIQLTIQPTDPAVQGFTESFRYNEDKSLIEMALRAEKLAQIIGRQLAARDPRTASQQAYHCFADGDARLDPTNEQGLRMSLKCFNMALDRDEKFGEAHASIALAQILLMQLNKASSEEMRDIRQRANAAIKIDPESARAHLALGVISWQLDGDFRRATLEFEKASPALENDWHFQYQLAFFLMADGKPSQSLAAITRARQLDPTSVHLQITDSRFRWFAGKSMESLYICVPILNNSPNNGDARGLVIDILEHQGNCKFAKEVFKAAQISTSKLQDALQDRCPIDVQRQHFAMRSVSLADYPYGPYGDALNQLILDLRQGKDVGEIELRSRFGVAPPWLRLLLAGHPALQPLTTLEYTIELLQRGTDSGSPN